MSERAIVFCLCISAVWYVHILIPRWCDLESGFTAQFGCCWVMEADKVLERSYECKNARCYLVDTLGLPAVSTTVNVPLCPVSSSTGLLLMQSSNVAQNVHSSHASTEGRPPIIGGL